MKASGQRMWAGAAVAVMAGMVMGQVSGPATAATTRAAADWQGTLAKLGSAEFAEREAGQRELAKATLRDREALKKLAEGEGDPEVKARVAVEVEALDDEAALNPPGITLELTKATRETAVDALARAVGMKMTSGGLLTAAVSVHAVDRPFGDVFLEMNKPELGAGVSSGPFAIAPWRVTKTMTNALGPGRGGRPVEAVVLAYMVAVDPRVKLTQAPMVETESILDELGGELMPASGGGQTWSVLAARWSYAPMQQLELGDGKKVMAARGVAHFSVVVREERWEVADMAKDFAKPVQLGGQVITFTRFAVAQGQVQFNLASRPADGVRVAGPGNRNDGVKLTLMDGGGRQVWETTIGMGNGIGGGIGGQFQGPISAVFSRATKVKVVDVPFEFKDLSMALPAAGP